MIKFNAIFSKAILASVISLSVFSCTDNTETIKAKSTLFSEAMVTSSIDDVTIYTGGDIITMNRAQPTAEAVAIQNGKIISLDTLQNLNKQYQGANHIDLAGNTLMPGLIETHTHLMLAATQKQWIELGPLAFDSVDEMRKAFKEITPSESGRIQGIGWEVGSLELSINEMDEIFPNNPVLIVQRGHGIWANTLAFEAVGVNKDSVAPEGARFVKDVNGELTGYVAGQSGVVLMLGGRFPSATMTNVLEVADEVAGLGFTTYADIGVSNPNDLVTMRTAIDSEDFPVKIVAALMDIFPGLDDYLPKLKSYENDKLKFIGIKTWIDGSVQGGNMDSELHYHVGAFNETKGPFKPTQADYNEVSDKAFDAGLGFVFHANGEQGLLKGLAAVKHTQDRAKANKLSLDNFLTQAIHVSLSTDEAYTQMVDLGVQPTYLLGHFYYNGGRYVDELLGKEPMENLGFRMKTALDHGLKAAIHNDFPVTPTEPFLMMETAVTRQIEDGRIIAAHEGITIEQALEGYTINAAHQFRIQDKVGSIETDKQADFIIIDKNPLKIDISEVSDIKLLATYMNGKRTFVK